MSTSVVNPTPTPSLWRDISNHFKQHEKLCIVIVLILFGWIVSGKVINYMAVHDAAVYNTDKAKLQAQVDANAQKAEANAQQAAANQQMAERYAALAQSLADANKTLAAQQAARDTATQKQQVSDRALPPTDLASRWATLIKAPVTTVRVIPTGISVDLPSAQETVVQLESVPQLTADLKDEISKTLNLTQQLAAQGGVVAGLNKQVAGLNDSVTGLNTEIADVKKKDAAELALVKKQATKSKRRWFIIGYIAGWASAEVARKFGL